MDGDYVEMGIENGHLKFQRLKDDDHFFSVLSLPSEQQILVIIIHFPSRLILTKIQIRKTCLFIFKNKQK